MITAVKMTGRWIISKNIDLLDEETQEGIEYTVTQGTPVIICADLEDFKDKFNVKDDNIDFAEE